MKKLVLALCMFAPVAVAQTTIGNGSIGAGSNSASTSTSTSTAGSQANSNQGQEQGQNQGQQQGQSSQQGQQQGQAIDTSGNVVGNSSNTFNFAAPPANTTNRTTLVYDGEQRIRSVPSVIAPIMNPTTPCTSTYTFGAAAMGWGASAGASVTDTECTRRESARMLQALGAADAAFSLMCGNKDVYDAAPAMCRQVQDKMKVAQVLPVPTTQPATPAAPTAKPAPVSGDPAVKEYKQDGKTYRWVNGMWQQVQVDTEAEEIAKHQQLQQQAAYRR